MSKFYEAFGEVHTLFDWFLDSRFSVSWASLRERVRKGWEMEQALTTPMRKQRHANLLAVVAEDIQDGLSNSEIMRKYSISETLATRLRKEIRASLASVAKT